MGYRYNPFGDMGLDRVDTTNVPSSYVSQFDAESGTAIPVSHIINFIGNADQGISSSASGSTVTYTISNSTTSQKGVVELATDAETIAGSDSTRSVTSEGLKAKLGDQTQYGVPYGGGSTSAVDWTSAGSDGQLVIGATGGAPTFASLTSTGGTIVYTPGVNSLNLESTGGAAAETFTTDSGTATSSGNNINTVGDGDFLTTSGATDVVTLNATTHFQATGAFSWNGSTIEKGSTTVSSDGATISLAIEQSGGGDLTLVFSSGFYTFDCTPAATVTLTAGTDTAPQTNYVYIPQSTKVLTVSTSGFPSTEAVKVAIVVCPSASLVQTNGPYLFQQWLDDTRETNNQGHITDYSFWIRNQFSTWISGVSQTFTITTNVGTPDNVYMETTEGVVLQLHKNTFPAMSNPVDYYIINDFTTPYTIETDLNQLLTDSTGASMSGKYFSLVLWGVVNQTTGDCKMMVNLPSGSYNNESSLLEDLNKYATYTIPTEYKGVGFLIAEWKLHHTTTSGGTWESVDQIDLRGYIPSLTPGGAAVSPNEFDDSVFRIYDDVDDSKKIAFQASSITASTTRTITMCDSNIDLAQVATTLTGDSGSATGSSNVITVAGAGGISTSGSGSTLTVRGNGSFTDWTPAFAFGGGTTGMTYTSQIGHYIQFGEVAFVYLAIQFSNKGTSTGDATITGFPLTFKTSGGNQSVNAGLLNAITLSGGRTQVSLNLQDATSTIRVYQFDGAGSTFISTTDTNFSNTSTIECNFIAFVD